MASTPDSIGFVHEETMLRVVDVKRSTWQNWVRNEVLDAAGDSRYRESDVVELGVVALLVRILRNLDDVRTIWRPAREEVLGTLLGASETPESTLLVEPKLLRLQLMPPETPLGDALRPHQPTVALPLTDSIRGLREDFWRFARQNTKTVDRRRRTGSDGKQRRRHLRDA
jgi:hypothetical protein